MHALFVHARNLHHPLVARHTEERIHLARGELLPDSFSGISVLAVALVPLHSSKNRKIGGITRQLLFREFFCLVVDETRVLVFCGADILMRCHYHMSVRITFQFLRRPLENRIRRIALKRHNCELLVFPAEQANRVRIAAGNEFSNRICKAAERPGIPILALIARCRKVFLEKR